MEAGRRVLHVATRQSRHPPRTLEGQWVGGGRQGLWDESAVGKAGREATDSE